MELGKLGKVVEVSRTYDTLCARSRTEICHRIEVQSKLDKGTHLEAHLPQFYPFLYGVSDKPNIKQTLGFEIKFWITFRIQEFFNNENSPVQRIRPLK